MEKRSFYAVFALQATAVVIAVAPGWFLLTHGKAWDARQYFGTILIGTGVVFWALARFQLGRSFAVKARAHELITHGLYSKIRSPIYLFGTMILAGFIVLLRMPILWILLAALVVMQRIRARKEAIVLEAAFGQAYRDYRNSTWF